MGGPLHSTTFPGGAWPLVLRGELGIFFLDLFAGHEVVFALGKDVADCWVI